MVRASLLVLFVSGCGVDSGELPPDPVKLGGLGLTKGSGGVNGDSDYCNDKNFKCTAGEGDCDKNLDCDAGLKCQADSGYEWAFFDPLLDVCEGVKCRDGLMNFGESGVDCGGLCKPCNACALGPPIDSDHDGIYDACDPCDLGPNTDIDGDGVFDACDSCNLGPNVDSDDDGVFDACDPCPSDNPDDTDGDGVCGVDDLCPGFDDNVDTDLDGIPDGCDSRDVWSYGGADTDFAWEIAVDPADGAIVVVGKFIGTSDFGTGRLSAVPSADPLVPTSDLFVAKYDANGWPLWSRRFGGSGDDGARDAGVAIDGSSNIYVGSDFKGTVDFGLGNVASAGLADGVLLKLDAAGATQWVKTFGAAADDRVGGVVYDGANVWLGGSFSGSVNFGGGALTSLGGTDLVLAGWTPAGGFVAANRFGGTGTDVALDVAVSGSNAYLAGSFTGTATFGATVLTSGGGNDALLLEADRTSGAVGWAKRWGNTNNDQALAVAADASGPVVVGFFVKTVDFGSGPVTTVGVDRTDAFVVALDAAGVYRWDQTFGGNDYDQAMCVALDPATGDALVGGSVASTVSAFYADGSSATSAGASDAFLMRFAGATGVQGRTDLYGSTGADTFRGVDADGVDAYFAGHASGAITVDGNAFTNQGGLDVILGRHPF